MLPPSPVFLLITNICYSSLLWSKGLSWLLFLYCSQQSRCPCVYPLGCKPSCILEKHCTRFLLKSRREGIEVRRVWQVLMCLDSGAFYFYRIYLLPCDCICFGKSPLFAAGEEQPCERSCVSFLSAPLALMWGRNSFYSSLSPPNLQKLEKHLVSMPVFLRMPGENVQVSVWSQSWDLNWGVLNFGLFLCYYWCSSLAWNAA